ncbi:MAG: tetratricopeptide repeat protein [Bacteroidetes bacterium]|nr:tetratricopeptide repeat protein [Bacteroidota bacterium]
MRKNTRPFAYIPGLLIAVFLAGAQMPVTAQIPVPESDSPGSSSEVKERNEAKERKADLALQTFVLGSTHEFEERYSQALVVYKRTLELDEHPAVHLAIARVAHAVGDEITTAHHLLRAREARPDDAATLRQLGELYSARKQADSALYILEELRRIEGDSEQLLLAMGGLYTQQRLLDEAASIYDTLRVQFPDNPSYALMLAEIEMNRGRWVEASALMLPLAADSAVGHEDRVQIGKIYFQRVLRHPEEISSATQVFERLVRDFPEDWRPLWFLAATLFNAGAVDEALPSFEAVLLLSPANTEAGMILARAYLGQRRPNEALRTLQRLIDHDAAAKDTWNLLAYTWSILGRNDRAAEALEEVRRQHPADIEILFTLGVTYAGLQRFDSSDALFEETLRQYDEQGVAKDERYYQLLNNFAFTLAEREIQLERALEMSRVTVDHSPANSVWCDTFGWVYFRLQRYEDALHWLRRALQLRDASEQSSATLHEHLGEVYRALNRVAEARSHWEEALRQEPENEALREKLRLLPDTGD